MRPFILFGMFGRLNGFIMNFCPYFSETGAKLEYKRGIKDE